MMEVWAKHAKQMKAEETRNLQAALAFEFLRKEKEDISSRGDATPAQGSWFVILGRPADTDLENFANWTKDAILCDPWRHDVGIAAQLATWFQETKVNLLCRVEG